MNSKPVEEMSRDELLSEIADLRCQVEILRKAYKRCIALRDMVIIEEESKK